MSLKISAFVITKNEEKNIRNCLASLSFADEVIVVDSESQDQTVEIAKKHGAKVYTRAWTGFSDQRNHALSQCQYPWVFFLDADEVCSPELIQWFLNLKKEGEDYFQKNLLPSPSEHPRKAAKSDRIDLIEIRRLEHFQGQLYQYGNNNPSHQWRFFRREFCRFIGDVHEYVVFDGKILRLEKPIMHFPKETISEVMKKINIYSSIEAEALYKKGVKHNVFYMFFSGLAMFLKSYFRKQGFRDGILGFILAVLAGTGFFLRQAKLYLKHQGLE